MSKVLPENKNLNNKIKTFEQLPSDFAYTDGVNNIPGIDTDSYLKNVYNSQQPAPITPQGGDFGIEGAVIAGNVNIKRDDINMREMPLNGWYQDLRVYRGLRNFDTENDLIVKQSHIDGRSSGILSESTPTYIRMADQGYGLPYNPNSVVHTVMEGIPRGGASTRF